MVETILPPPPRPPEDSGPATCLEASHVAQAVNGQRKNHGVLTVFAEGDEIHHFGWENPIDDDAPPKSNHDHDHDHDHDTSKSNHTNNHEPCKNNYTNDHEPSKSNHNNDNEPPSKSKLTNEDSENSPSQCNGYEESSKNKISHSKYYHYEPYNTNTSLPPLGRHQHQILICVSSFLEFPG
jgi:hypothetical protein